MAVEIVSVPFGYVSTGRAWRIIFDEMFPGEMERSWGDYDQTSRELFNKQVEECSARLLSALIAGDLVALIDEGGVRKIVPGPRWSQRGATASLTTGNLLTDAPDLTPCFIDEKAFEAWRLSASAHTTSRQTGLGEKLCRQFLVEQMKRNARPSENRGWYQKECVKRFGVSVKGFLRQWARAMEEARAYEWKKAGPKSKRRIDPAA